MILFHSVVAESQGSFLYSAARGGCAAGAASLAQDP